MNINGDSWTIQCEVVQRQDLAEEPPEEDPMPNELEMGAFVPFDFFGLGQPVEQQDQEQEQNQGQGQNDQQGQNGQQEEQNGHQMGQQQQDLNGGQGLNEQNLVQQVNPWEPQQMNPWDPWPAEIPAQQQAQNALDLNLAPMAQQEVGIDLNAPVDPMEVIINPINPPIQDYIELNDIAEVIEEHIPQPQQPNPVQEQNLIQNEEDDNMEVMGFPLPPLEDLLGEEVPMDQLLGEEDDDLDLNLLVGPEEEGFPMAHNGGVQLPINQDDLNQEQVMDQGQGQMLDQDQGAAHPVVQEIPQFLPNHEGELAQDVQPVINEQLEQVVLVQQPHINNNHMQIGMALVPEPQWDLILREQKAQKETEHFTIWENPNLQGN